uniref:Putative WRKY transcription factor 46 n=1 Tax=Davidia involucrata TaxID=16924 RepID=A0A5B7C2R3_DAVIN
MEKAIIINELTQGRELVNQLKRHLDPSTSRQTCELLLDKILSSYEKSLSMLNWGGFAGEPQPARGSPHSFDASNPRSEGSDPDSKDQCHRDVFKKRKTLPRWTEQVRVCSGTGVEGPLDDGYSWRKYGQKDILGANFPRAYYRCTHRNVQGCLATKQVQRSDQDSSIFQVTYRGRHTCIQSSHLNPASETQGPKPSQDHQEKQEQSQEMLLNFGTDLKVEELGSREEIFPSFSFPSTPIDSENEESLIFAEPMKENSFMGNYSPAFLSPATSESNYFSLSPCQMNFFGMDHNLQTSESDINEIISAPTSVTNSPIGDLDFPLDQVDFDPNFQFDTSEFFT